MALRLTGFGAGVHRLDTVAQAKSSDIHMRDTKEATKHYAESRHGVASVRSARHARGPINCLSASFCH